MKGYDVCIGSAFNRPSICLISPILLKDFYNAPIGTFIKSRITI